MPKCVIKNKIIKENGQFFSASEHGFITLEDSHSALTVTGLSVMIMYIGLVTFLHFQPMRNNYVAQNTQCSSLFNAQKFEAPNANRSKELKSSQSLKHRSYPILFTDN